jgi:hypothetical protein
MTRILDPTLRAARADTASPAPRPDQLAGAAIGLLANGKSNGMALLDAIAAAVRRKHDLRDVVRVAKTNASIPANADEVGRLLGCAAVITAIGD